MPTIQELDHRLADRLAAARVPLIAALTEAARGKPWHYLLFGSMARGRPRRGSDADIAVVGAASHEQYREAVEAAAEACRALDLPGDIMAWEDLAGPVREAASLEGIRCGG
jgi:predicted nucleotidyltransferase